MYYNILMTIYCSIFKHASSFAIQRFKLSSSCILAMVNYKRIWTMFHGFIVCFNGKLNSNEIESFFPYGSELKGYVII
jgi:hypothetical protein